jgi:radical SAM superfamily enzyme YgiQ (UPF0313 family)
MVKIGFADLSHTRDGEISANAFPLGISMVASYAKKELKGEIEVEIFKDPKDFNTYLKQNQPAIVCFSIYVWNTELSRKFAFSIRKKFPDIIIVAGGPSIPLQGQCADNFKTHKSGFDFWIWGEGELAFVELYRKLKDYNFNKEAFIKSRTLSPNVGYFSDEKLIVGETLPRISDLNQIPSPYTEGLCDKFFGKKLIPTVETNRGCPYACTFCQEGDLYFNKIRCFSRGNIHKELEYITQQAVNADLNFGQIMIVDSNFGMFDEDLVTSQKIVDLMEKYNWPHHLMVSTAKNTKKRIIEISKMMKGSITPAASVQSTDPSVLKMIKRTNLPFEDVIRIAKTTDTDGALSHSEIILCLPGDSKKAHFKSVLDMIEAGISSIRLYQYSLLPGTEGASAQSLKQFDMETRFRVRTTDLGFYQIYEDVVWVAEVEAISVANNTMTYSDYRDCRALDLTVEIFHNNGAFREIAKFLSHRGIKGSEFIFKIHSMVYKGNTPISHFYDEYAAEEEKNSWTNPEELRAFTQEPENSEKYLSGKYGINEIYKYRALAFFHNLDVLHDIVHRAAHSLLEDKGFVDERTEIYLNEVSQFSFMRKRNLFELELDFQQKFYFDFEQLANSNFSIDPFELFQSKALNTRIFHSQEQKSIINTVLDQYGNTLIGIGRILNRTHIGSMYRIAQVQH